VLRAAQSAQLSHLDDHPIDERLQWSAHSGAAAKGTLKRRHQTTTLR
jgi:hypothetical protein